MGDVNVKVNYSTMNFKDGIVLTGAPGVAKKFPIVGGIDFAGTVLESKSPLFKPGQSVVLTGHYNGQHMDGGHADIVRTKHVTRELVHFDKFDGLPYQDPECDVT